MGRHRDRGISSRPAGERMTPVTFLLLALAGGVGASLRLVVDAIIRSRLSTTFPVGTMLVNLTGCLLLGFITALAAGHLIPEELRLVLGAGLLGGYTTFSTASFETVRLAQEGRYGAALLNGPGLLVAGVLASVLGLWLGSLG
jgi:CrcB protein